jgi:tetratricopeptide (TPR) repeat protein
VTGTRPNAGALRWGPIAVLAVACLAAGCDRAGDEARREYLQVLELSKTGRPLEEQLAHADRAVRLVPTGATYVEKRAGLLFGLGRLAEARMDYDRAVELADRPYLRFERADLLCALGEDDAAHADLDRAIAAQPANVQFYARRALARLALGRVAEARADVARGIAASPAGESERYARAAVLLLEGKPAEALPDLDFVIARFSDATRRALPRTVRLLALVALDRRERAAAEFDRQTRRRGPLALSRVSLLARPPRVRQCLHRHPGRLPGRARSGAPGRRRTSMSSQGRPRSISP